MAATRLSRVLVGIVMAFTSALAVAAPGTCTVTPANVVIDAGDSVTLTATCTGTVASVNWKEGGTSFTGDIVFAAPQAANSPFTFSTPRTLTGGTPSSSHTITFTATDGTSIDATSVVSVRQGPALSVSVSGTGTVTSSPAGINCSAGTCNANYAANATVMLAATPGANATFTGWSGDCTGTGTCVLAMQSARSVTATFGAVTHGACFSNPASTTAPANPNLCTAGAGSGVATAASTFTWTCTGSDNQAVSCSSPRAFTVSATAPGGHGSVAVAGSPAQYGGTVTVTATPEATYFTSFAAAGCSGTTSGAGNTIYTISNVSSDCAVTANFSQVQQYTVTPVATGGTITPNSAVQVNSGATTQFTLSTPAANQTLVVTGCGGSLNTSTYTYTTGTVTTNCTVTATYTTNNNPNADPGLLTGFWIPPGTTNYVVVDQMGVGGAAARTYLPGCVNQSAAPANSSTGCAIQMSFTGPLAGGGTHTLTLGANKTVAIRYKSKPTIASTNKVFRVENLSGNPVQYSTVTVWLSPVPGAGPETVPAGCAATSNSLPQIITHATSVGKCNPTPDTIYYLNIRPDGPCLASGTACNFNVTENNDFLYP